MRYLITSNADNPYLTNWFSPQNHYIVNIGMVVYDLAKQVFTADGKSWQPIEIDHL
jgi:hypothetical protein